MPTLSFNGQTIKRDTLEECVAARDAIQKSNTQIYGGKPTPVIVKDVEVTKDEVIVTTPVSTETVIQAEEPKVEVVETKEEVTIVAEEPKVEVAPVKTEQKSNKNK